MGTTRSNLEKKSYLWKKLKEQASAGLPYSEKKIIAEFCIDCGTTRKTALEMLKLLEDAERIIRTEGKIYLTAVFNSDLTIKEGVFDEGTNDKGNSENVETNPE